MALLLLASGTSRGVTYAGPSGWSLDELYALLDCTTVQTIALADGRTMVMDDDGKAARKHVNAEATRLAMLAGIAREDFVVGDVLLCVVDGEGDLR